MLEFSHFSLIRSPFETRATHAPQGERISRAARLCESEFMRTQQSSFF